MAFVAGVNRACPHCGGEAFHALPDYSVAPWQIVQCPACSFVFLRNPPQYERPSSEFAWEKTRVAEVERQKSNRPVRIWLDRMTRWRAAIYSPGIAGRLRLFVPGRVLDVGCGSGKKVPEPFIQFGIEISEVLSRDADAHMRTRGGRAIHAPAVEGVKEFPDRYFTGILLRSFLEHEKEPKKLLEQWARVLAPRWRHLCAGAKLRQPEPADARRQMVRLPLSRPRQLLHHAVARRHGRRLRAQGEAAQSASPTPRRQYQRRPARTGHR
jgi:SAM-dependent methyltransferase